MNLYYSANAVVKWSIVNASGQRWNTSGTPAFENHSDGDWAEYLITDAQVGTSATRYLALPAVGDGDFRLEGYDTDNADLGDVPDIEAFVSIRSAAIVTATSTLRADDRDGDAIAKASATATILNRLGVWTGSARNTILGAFQAMFRKDADASVPGDINADLGNGAGAASNTTDSLEAIRDRGDAAWLTATGFATSLDVSSAVTAIQGGDGDTLESLSGQIDDIAASSLTAQGVRDAMKLAPTAGAPAAGSVDLHLDAIQAKSDLITSAAVNMISPLLESGAHMITVRGDSYEVGSVRGAYEWEPDDDGDWPDLTGATIAFTSRRKSDDEAELSVTGEAVNPAGPGKAIRVELTAAQTAVLTPGAIDGVNVATKSNKFDVQVTLASGEVWTPIRGGDNLRSGGHTIVEDQTRA